MEIYNDEGVPLDAAFHVQAGDGELTILFESCGGGRNKDYNPALQLVLERLGLRGATLSSAEIETRDTQHLSVEDRRLDPEEPFPIVLEGRDHHELRLAMGRSAAQLGRSPGADGGGNTQKQLRLHLAFPGVRRPKTSELEQILSQAPAALGGPATVASETGTGKKQALTNSAKRWARGQGYTSDPEVRGAVEARAIAVARQYFKEWTIESVEKDGVGFDLICTLDGETRHVEVKGTTGAGDRVILTPNEVEVASAKPKSALLFVVSGIEVSRQTAGVQAKGGEVRILHPWNPKAQGELRPSQYNYLLPPPKGD